MEEGFGHGVVLFLLTDCRCNEARAAAQLAPRTGKSTKKDVKNAKTKPLTY
jgi:hypothetical protein